MIGDLFADESPLLISLERPSPFELSRGVVGCNRKYIKGTPPPWLPFLQKIHSSRSNSEIDQPSAQLQRRLIIMDDQTSAFTCDDGFFESAWTGDDDVIHTAVNALMPPDATRNNDTIGASNNAIYYRRTNILTTTSCEESSVGANLQAVESHPETLVNAISCEKSDYDSVGSVGRCFSRIEPETSDQRNSAESDSATSPAGMTENLVLGGMGLGISQDPVCASALDGCAVNAAADSEEDVPPIVLQAYKAAQKTQGEAEDDLAEKALEGENTASDVLCPSPRRKTYRPMRPSRGVHPIDDSQPFAERRLAPPLRPSRGVQPMISQKIALSVVIETASDPRAVVPRVTDSSLMEFSSSESGYVSPPVSRKRATAEETSETAKRVRQSDEGISLALIRYDH